MKEKEKYLKKLRRTDLLELLVSQAEEIEKLQAENESLQAKLADKDLLIAESGSIAEAALKINNIFEVAQRAADQYVQNVKRSTEDGVGYKSEEMME